MTQVEIRISSLKSNQQKLSTQSETSLQQPPYSKINGPFWREERAGRGGGGGGGGVTGDSTVKTYLKKVQEGFDVTKELFHRGFLDVQTEILDQFLVHGGHILVHFHKNVDLVLGAAVKTVSVVKEFLSPCFPYHNRAKHFSALTFSAVRSCLPHVKKAGDHPSRLQTNLMEDQDY